VRVDKDLVISRSPLVVLGVAAGSIALAVFFIGFFEAQTSGGLVL
jgi:hypothetical protein